MTKRILEQTRKEQSIDKNDIIISLISQKAKCRARRIQNKHIMQALKAIFFNHIATQSARTISYQKVTMLQSSRVYELWKWRKPVTGPQNMLIPNFHNKWLLLISFLLSFKKTLGIPNQIWYSMGPNLGGIVWLVTAFKERKDFRNLWSKTSHKHLCDYY